MKKPPILIAISTDILLRNFVQSGAFERLQEEYEVHYILSSKVSHRGVFGPAYRFAGNVQETLLRLTIRQHLRELTMTRFQELSTTWKISRKRVPEDTLRIYNLLSHPKFFPFVFGAAEACLGYNDGIEAVIRRVKPVWILLPNMCNDSLAVDVIKSARKMGVRTLLLVNGWDNITSKGTIPYLPTLIGVWGEESRKQAIRIHGFSGDQVRVMGAPHFQHYFSGLVSHRGEFLRMQGIAEEKKVLLFAGCILKYDELPLVVELDNAIESGELAGLHVLYRPHPWRHYRDGEEEFLNLDLRHTTVDLQVRDAFRESITKRITITPRNFLPDLNYYPSMLNAIDGIVSPLSTIIIEGAVFGKPSLAFAFPDGRHAYSGDNFIQFQHFKEMMALPAVRVCRDRKFLVEHVRELVSMTRDAELAKRQREGVRQIVYWDDKTYADRLMDVLSEPDGVLTS